MAELTSCVADHCTDVNDDCCAPLEFDEPATCAEGYTPRRTGKECFGFRDAAFVCCSQGDRAALCRQHTDQPTVALRAKLGRPDGYSSCALVGSSGLLLRSRLGAEIDSHDLVIRMVRPAART